MNEDVKGYLDHYLFSGEETDYAVMLNGPWGAGKTHFVRNYFAERDARAKAEDPLNGSCYLYASLYGVRTTAEITDQFFAQVNPVFAWKPIRLFGSVLARALNGRFGTDVSSGADAIFKDLVTRLDDKILVFDDLERCAMPLADVMGFINGFVEHDGLKVIVVANEDDIPQSQKAEYSSKKEKLIGKTLRVSSDPKAVLESVLSKLTVSEVRKTIEREECALLRVFSASGRPNFRSLRAVLFDYQRLVSVADARLAEAPQAMTALLLLMIAVGCEYRAGQLSAADIAGLQEWVWRRYFPKGADAVPPEIVLINRLCDAYPEVRWDDWVVPPAVLATLFEQGLVDVVALNNHLAKHPMVVGYAAVPAWRQLWAWHDMPRSQYLIARAQLLSDLEARNLIHPGIILHAVGVVIGLTEFGDPLLGSMAEAVSFFKTYVEKLREERTLEPARDVFDSWVGAYDGLGYTSKDKPEFQEIFAAVRSATFGAFADRMRLAAPDLMERLTWDPESYASLHKHGAEEGKYADAPILHHLNVDDFAKVAIRDWATNGSLLAALVARYQGDRWQGALTDEHEWLNVLRSKLDAVVAVAEPPYKRMLEIRLEYYFSEIARAVSSAKDFLAARSERGAAEN